MIKAGQVVRTTPEIPTESERKLRAMLIMEECLETIQALGVDVDLRYHGVGAGGFIPLDKKMLVYKINERRGCNLVQVADGCADISVVTYGTLISCGIADVELIEEVDRSNLDKFRGDAHRDPETGKWIKPSDWQPPRIRQILIDQGWEPGSEGDEDVE